MSSNQMVSTVPQLPEEMFEFVISKAEPATVGRSMVLSSYWRDIISSVRFQKNHKKEMKNQNNIGLILQQELAFEGLEYVRGTRLQATRMVTSIRHKYYLACCDSYVLVCDRNGIYSIENPTTGSSFIVKPEEIIFPEEISGCRCLFGLGYNIILDDFYVIRISIYNGSNMRSEVRLYSMRCKLWRIMPDFGNELPISCPGCYANGAFHWMLYAGRIAVFTIAPPKWSNIELPTGIPAGEMYTQLTEFNNEKLVIYQFSHAYGDPLTIYVMEEYPDPSTWKRITVAVRVPINILNRVTFQPLYMMEPRRDKIMFRCNPLNCYGYMDLKQNIFIWTSNSPISRFAATTFAYNKSLEDVALKKS